MREHDNKIEEGATFLIVCVAFWFTFPQIMKAGMILALNLFGQPLNVARTSLLCFACMLAVYCAIRYGVKLSIHTIHRIRRSA